MMSWRDCSLSDQQLHMLHNQLYTDCTVRVHGSRDMQEFHLHKALLARASEVFEAMLLPSGGGMLEASTGVVEIQDMEPHTFTIMLEHMYGHAEDLVAEGFDSVERVAVAADRYLLPVLKRNCLNRLLALLAEDINTVWRALRLADMLPDFQELKSEALMVIRRFAAGLLSRDEFLEIDHPTLLAIVSDARLNLRDSEMELITPVFKWAHHHAAREQVTPRAALGEVMNHLRFLNLHSLQFMATCMTPANLTLFSQEEVAAILHAIQNREDLEPVRELGLSTDTTVRGPGFLVLLSELP